VKLTPYRGVEFLIFEVNVESDVSYYYLFQYIGHCGDNNKHAEANIKTFLSYHFLFFITHRIIVWGKFYASFIACLFDIHLYLTPLGQAMQSIETCGK
jgi:hypothetical protein